MVKFINRKSKVVPSSYSNRYSINKRLRVAILCGHT